MISGRRRENIANMSTLYNVSHSDLHAVSHTSLTGPLVGLRELLEPTPSKTICVTYLSNTTHSGQHLIQLLIISVEQSIR